VGSVIRVLWGPGWTRLASPLADARSTDTTGEWPSPTITASACQGSKEGDRCPSPRSLENAVLQRTMWGPRSAPLGAAMDSSAECGLAPLRVRGLERVALHADLVMLARLSQALARAAGRPARRIESGRHDSQRRHSERRWPAGGPHSASPRDVEPVERTSREC